MRGFTYAVLLASASGTAYATIPALGVLLSPVLNGLPSATQQIPSSAALLPATSCASSKVVPLASALSTCAPARSYCASLYTQSVYSTGIQFEYVTSTAIKTVTPCAVAGGNESSRPTSFSTRHGPITITTVKNSASKPTTTISPDNAFSSLKKLPSKCRSSICASLAGTATVTTTVIAPTVKYVPPTNTYKPITCGAQEFCDNSGTNIALCRPKPGLNTCEPAVELGKVPTCKSTNGCTGGCYHVPVPGTTSASPLDYDANPQYYFDGLCAKTPANSTASVTSLPICNSDRDCGSSELCVLVALIEYNFRCVKAASELC